MTMNTEAILEQIEKIVAQIDEINATLAALLENDNAN